MGNSHSPDIFRPVEWREKERSETEKLLQSNVRKQKRKKDETIVYSKCKLQNVTWLYRKNSIHTFHLFIHSRLSASALRNRSFCFLGLFFHFGLRFKTLKRQKTLLAASLTITEFEWASSLSGHRCVQPFGDVDACIFLFSIISYIFSSIYLFHQKSPGNAEKCISSALRLKRKHLKKLGKKAILLKESLQSKSNNKRKRYAQLQRYSL